MDLKAINTLPRLGQPGVFLGFGLVMVGLGWYWFVSGYGAQIQLKRKQLEVLNREIGRGRETEHKHKKNLTRNRRLASRLARLKMILPDGKQTAELLRQVQEGAVGSHLNIKRFQPLPLKEREYFSEVPHHLVVDGTYHSLGLFFDRLSKLPRIVNVEDLRISTLDKSGSGHTITAACTAVTFIYDQEWEQVETAGREG